MGGWSLGWMYGEVITKISWMGRLPHFLRYGAVLACVWSTANLHELKPEIPTLPFWQETSHFHQKFPAFRFHLTFSQF